MTERDSLKLRGAFNPKLQLARAVLLTAIAVVILIELRGSEWAKHDFQVAPFAFLLGVGVGIPIGTWRFRALNDVLPEVNGILHLSETQAFSKTPSGANLLHIERLILAGAFVVWFLIDAHSNGNFILIGSLATFMLGEQLTGHTIPFLRLWRVSAHRDRTSTTNG